MPRGKYLKGVGPKEQRMYEHIKESAEKSGKYGKRAKEVAARTVMKKHKEKNNITFTFKSDVLKFANSVKLRMGEK